MSTMCTTTPLYHKITTIIRASWGYAQERAMQVISNKKKQENMAKGMITATNILKEKNFVISKFDQKGFSDKVAEFFLGHEVKDTLLLVPRRFVEMEAPEVSEDMTEDEKAFVRQKQEQTDEDKRRGWIDMTDISVWSKRVEDPYDTFSFSDYLIASKKGLIRPMFYVDEPFIKNAQFMLSAMQGFIVKKQRGGKYLISLI